MASAVNQLVDNYSTSQPVDWASYYNAYGRDHYSSWYDVNPDSIGGKFENFFSGIGSAAKASYENYLSEYEYRKNQAAKEAENRATWQREDTQVQRAVKDIEAAGLNPWLALNGGSMNSAVVSSQSASARYKAREQQLKQDKSGKSSNLLGTAMKLIAMMAIMG